MEKLDSLLKKYPQGERENLLRVLQEVQENFGYLKKEVVEEVASYFNVSPSELYSIITFYKKFRRIPLGKYPINVCLGTACYLMGGELILSEIMRELNIKPGETTEDRLFSLEKSACFGCCSVAPVIKIKEEIYPKMSPAKVEEILTNLKEK